MFHRWKWVCVCGCDDGVSPWEETQLEHPTPDTAAVGFVGWLTGELWLQTKCWALLSAAWLSQTVSTGLQSCGDMTMSGEWFVQQLYNVTLPLFVLVLFGRRDSLTVGGCIFQSGETLRSEANLAHSSLCIDSEGIYSRPRGHISISAWPLLPFYQVASAAHRQFAG